MYNVTVHFASKQLGKNNDSLDFMTFSTCLSFRKYLIMIYHNYVIISHKKEMHIHSVSNCLDMCIMG